MENEEGQAKYFQLYTQKQESLLIDFIRKSLDLEIRSQVLSVSLSESKKKIEELSSQVEILNKTVEEATDGIKALTYERTLFDEKENELKDKIKQLENKINQMTGDKNGSNIENKN